MIPKKRLVFFMLQWACVSFVNACPSCKDALAAEGTMALARGYYWSILLLLAVPFGLVGFIAFLIYRSYQLKIKSDDSASLSSPSID